MVVSAATWEKYERWNDAIAQIVYPTSAAGAPVYLDLEDEVLAEIRDLAEPDASEPKATLIDAVRGTLRLDEGPARIFNLHQNRLKTWADGSMLDPPPTLGLLALLSLAAENMHHGDGKAAHNFYFRVQQLLQIDDRQRKHFEDAYRRRTRGRATSEELWSSVNIWLEMLEGNRGLPTAFALAHAHVGLPLSQALVRQADREKFAAMFTAYGLAPFGSLPSRDMQQIIDEWIARVPCPASNSLEQMWKRDPTARERIVDVALLTLEAWDGSLPEGLPASSAEPIEIDHVRAKALLRNFPSRQLEVSFVVPASRATEPETLEVLDHEGQLIGSLDLVPASSGWAGLADPLDIDVASFLNGETSLRRENRSQPLRRRPRRLVPMRRDDLLQAFVECERVQLGEDALLLVRSEIAAKVDWVLATAARPGYSRHDTLPGLPSGWVLFDGVQILSSIPTDQLHGQLVDLHLLQPLANSQVVLQGGLRLPGNIRKWSSALPPELRASSQEGSSLTAHLTCTRPLTSPAPEDQEVLTEEPVLVWDLAEANLPDGDYEITVREDHKTDVKREVLRLRSADNPALMLNGDVPLAHDPSTPMFGLLPSRCQAISSFRGVPDDDQALPEATPPQEPGWYSARKTSKAQPPTAPRLRFPVPVEGSCMATGAHHMMVDTPMAGQATVEGECKYCGLVKRYPTRGRQRGSNAPAGNAKLAPNVNVHELEQVKEPMSVDWRAGFDALCHVGAGPMSALDRIAMQMEPTGLFGDSFARRLDVLGHIEIEREPASLASKGWEVIDPAVIQLPGKELVLIGFRNESMIVAVEDKAWAAKAELTIDPGVEAPPVIKISGMSTKVLDELARAIEDTTARPLTISPATAESLAARLPPLSHALAGLPTTRMIQARSYEYWNPTTARFAPADDAGRPGAFRLKGFTRAYIYRRPDDIGSMTALLGDARIVKYAAALDSRASLLGYDPSMRVLYVPLGADLPGLYGRAAVLASGYPPRENAAERILEYPDVPPKLAGRLSQLLMS